MLRRRVLLARGLERADAQMVLFNYSTKELTAKVVYYGPGLCGKTTNLQWIHEKLPIRNKGKMLSLATEADRTLFFDFLPIELGTIRGMKTRIQLYTVPGQVFYNATRRMVLKGADCVVFVADSQEPMLDANLDAMTNLRENLEVNEIDADEIPMVLQYNKRDLPNALPTEILDERLNPRGLPFYEAVAMKGQGVEETLKGATALVFKSLAGRYGGTEASASPAPALAGPSAPTVAAPVLTAPSSPAPSPPAPVAPAPRAAPVPVAPQPPPARPPMAPAPAAQTVAVPAPRPAPAPAPPPAPVITPSPSRMPMPAPGLATLPPLNLPPPPTPADDLLESIDLQPAADGLEDAPELHLEPAGPGEELVFEDDHAGVSNGPSPEARPPAPAPPPPPPPPAPAAQAKGKTTLVSRPNEAEELRRRIGRRLEPEMVLEEVDEEDEDIEEITFEPPSMPRAALAEAPTSPRINPPPVPAPVAMRPPEPFRAPDPPSTPDLESSDFSFETDTVAPPAAASRAPEPPPPPPLPTVRPIETTVPVEVSSRPGETDVVVPVEVTVQQGAAQVNVHLRLTLKIRIVD
jgi:mutual gliding-motility protein MglA